jgi:hypothetical protein
MNFQVHFYTGKFETLSNCGNFVEITINYFKKSRNSISKVLHNSIVWKFSRKCVEVSKKT